MDDSLLMDCFVGAQLRKEVIARIPQSLSHAVALAKLFEEKLVPLFPSLKPCYPSFSSKSTYHPISPQSQSQEKPFIHPPSSNISFPLLPTTLKPSHLKKLSPMDIQFRREKGLCFTCDDKYSLTHKCANKHYFLLHTTEEVDDLVAELEYPQLVVVTPPDDGFDHLLYHALKGIVARGTIRFTGCINGIETQILLDGGNSDNFIQPRLLKFLKLTVHPTPPFQVVVGNGEQLDCEGQVHNIPIHIQGYCLHVSAYLLPIAVVELVLGTQ